MHNKGAPEGMQPDNVKNEITPPKKTVLARPKFWLAIIGVLVSAGLAAYILWYEEIGQYYESTDDAYVHSNIVRITPQVEGTVRSVEVNDTDIVKEGQILVKLDALSYQIAYERAKAQYKLAVLDAMENQALFAQRKAYLAQMEAEFSSAEKEMDRRKLLLDKAFISKEAMASFVTAVQTARARVDAAKQDVAAALTKLSGRPDLSVANQPGVQVAEQNLRQVYKDLSDTIIRAPVSGIIAKRSVQLGQHISSGQALMSVVPLDEPWIEANFKETQIKNIRVDQSATVTVDTYGSHPFSAKVVGVGSGTGAAFSLLPPQNATGNWVKVVQRVPVRLRLLDLSPANLSLAVGLSANVTIDTRNEPNSHWRAAPSEPSVASKEIRHRDLSEAIYGDINTIISQLLVSLSPRRQGVIVRFPEAANKAGSGPSDD